MIVVGNDERPTAKRKAKAAAEPAAFLNSGGGTGRKKNSLTAVFGVDKAVVEGKIRGSLGDDPQARDAVRI